MVKKTVMMAGTTSPPHRISSCDEDDDDFITTNRGGSRRRRPPGAKRTSATMNHGMTAAGLLCWIVVVVVTFVARDALSTTTTTKAATTTTHGNVAVAGTRTSRSRSKLGTTSAAFLLSAPPSVIGHDLCPRKIASSRTTTTRTRTRTIRKPAYSPSDTPNLLRPPCSLERGGIRNLHGRGNWGAKTTTTTTSLSLSGFFFAQASGPQHGGRKRKTNIGDSNSSPEEETKGGGSGSSSPSSSSSVSTNAMRDYIVKAHEDKLRAIRDVETRYKEEIRDLRSTIKQYEERQQGDPADLGEALDRAREDRLRVVKEMEQRYKDEVDALYQSRLNELKKLQQLSPPLKLASSSSSTTTDSLGSMEESGSLEYAMARGDAGADGAVVWNDFAPRSGRPAENGAISPSTASREELIEMVLAYKKFLSNYVIKAQLEKRQAVAEAEEKLLQKYGKILSDLKTAFLEQQQLQLQQQQQQQQQQQNNQRLLNGPTGESSGTERISGEREDGGDSSSSSSSKGDEK